MLSKDCSQKTGSRFKFCIEHWKKGLEDGSITAYDGQQYIVHKSTKDEDGKKDKHSSDKTNNTFGFTQANLRGMAAMTEHVSDHLTKIIDERLQTKNAYHAEPFAHAPAEDAQDNQSTGVFDRIGGGKVVEARQAKKQKSVNFIERLADASRQ